MAWVSAESGPSTSEKFHATKFRGQAKLEYPRFEVFDALKTLSLILGLEVQNITKCFL